MNEITRNKTLRAKFTPPMGGAISPNKPKFEVYAEEMIEKEVKQSGNSGRVYLPSEWVGRHVKIIRID